MILVIEMKISEKNKTYTDTLWTGITKEIAGRNYLQSQLACEIVKKNYKFSDKHHKKADKHIFEKDDLKIIIDHLSVHKNKKRIAENIFNTHHYYSDELALNLKIDTIREKQYENVIILFAGKFKKCKTGYMQRAKSIIDTYRVSSTRTKMAIDDIFLGLCGTFFNKLLLEVKPDKKQKEKTNDYNR